MADALGTPAGVVSDEEFRVDLAGLIAPQSSTLGVRTGVMLAPGATALVTGTAATGTMTVQIASHHWVTSRGVADGVYLGCKEAAGTVNIAAAPGANSRIDVVYVKQNDTSSTVSADTGTTQEVYGVVTGTAAVSPTKPALPVGALELATVTVAAGASSTNGAGVTITNTVPLTVARGAPIPVRSTAERTALEATAYPGLHVTRLDLGGVIERWVTGTTWARYDALQVPIRSRRDAVTASGTLSSGSSVPIAPAYTLPASPHGAGVPYRVRVVGQIKCSINGGLGATLTATVGSTSYEIDGVTNGGSSATFELSGEDDFYVTSGTAQTVTVSVTALAGTITVIQVGKVVIETTPYTAL